MISDGMGSSDGVELSLNEIPKATIHIKIIFDTLVDNPNFIDLMNYLYELEQILKVKFCAENLSMGVVARQEVVETNNSQGAK